MNDVDAIQQSYDLNDAPAYRVHRAARVLRIHLGRVIAEHGENMTMEQYFVFFRAHAHKGCRQGELADPRLEDYSNVTRLVDSLVKRELLERRPDPRDRRSHLIYLTSKGEEIASRLIPIVIAERGYVYDGLTLDDIRTFLHVVERLETNAQIRTHHIEQEGRNAVESRSS